MVFIEPIDDGIFKNEGVTIKCQCGHYLTASENQVNTGVIVCPVCGKKI